MRLNVVVNVPECLGCGICTVSCPIDIFEIVDDKARVKSRNLSRCTHDKLCAKNCPVNAILIEESAD